MSTASIARVREVLRVRARDGPARGAERGDPPRRAPGAGRERQHQEAVPVAAGQHRAGPPQRVDRLALVELELARAVVLLDHPRVLVRRLGLVEHAPARRRAWSCPAGSRAPRPARAGRAAKRAPRPERRDQRRAPRRARGTCAACRSPRSPTATTKNTPTSEPIVEIAYSRPATTPDSSTVASFSRVAHGETAPSSSSGTATSTSVPNSEAVNAPTLTVRRTRSRSATGTGAR